MAKQNQKAQEPSGTSFPKGNVVITGDKYYDTGTERQKFFSGDGVSKKQPGDNDGISMPIPFSIPFVPNVPPAKKTQEQVKPATVNTKKAEDIDATLQSNGIPIVKITSTSSDSPDSVKRKIEESVKEVNKRVRDVQKDINNPTVKKNVDNLAGDYFISAINAPVSVDDAFRQQTQSQEEIAKRIQQESYLKAQQAVSKSNDVFKELGGIEANQFPLAKMWNTGATSIPTSIVSNDDATEYIKDNNLSDIKAVDNFKILNDAVASGNVDYKSILGKVSEKSSKYQEFLNDQSYKKSVSDAVKTSKEIQELNATVQKQRKELAATGDMGVFFKTSKEIEDASKAIAEVYKNDAQVKEYIETSAALEEEYGKLSTIIQEIPAETKEKIKKADEAILKLENESPKDENGNAIIPDDKIQEYNDNAKIKNDIIESLSIKPINEKIKSLELKLGKVKDSKSVLDVKQQLAELSKKKEAVKELFVKAKKQEDEYTTTDKNEIALKNLLEKYRKQQIKIDEIKANSWIAMIYDKYKGNIDEGIIFNEYTNAVNAFNYEEFVKAKLAPVLPEKMNPKLKQVLQSQDYLYSTVQQKIVALSYYWHHNATGKSETDFIQSMKATIRMPIHIQALIGTMIQYKKEIDKERELEQKTSGLSSPELPKFLKGAGLAAMAMPDIRTHNYDIPSDEKTARQLFDVIYDRIMSLPQQPAGVVSDFFYGLSKTEAKDTIPFLGSLIGSVEQIELNRILKKPNFSRTKEEIRVVDAIGALSAIAHSLNQVKLTPYTLGNVAVPNLIKLVAEFAAFNSMGVAGVAVGEGNVATVFDNIITYGLILSGMEGKGVRALTTVGKEVATAFLKGGMITPVTFALGGAGTFYELSNQHVEAMFNYEDCKWENKEEHLKNTESNAMVFLDALGTHIIQNSTMYMGHFAERGVSKATKGIVNAFTKDLSILKSNPETKAATQSFISLITEPQTKKAYSEAIAYKVFNALSPYLRWVAKDNKQVFFGQLNGAVGLTSISLYNRILVDTLERELNISDNDFDFDIKEEFLNSIYTLAPLAFLHAGTSFTLGTLNRGIKGIAYQEYRPDFFDISATNTDITNVSAKNAMFIFPDYLRSDFKIFKSILKDIINATSDSYLEKSKYDNIISNIEKLQQKGEHKLSVILGNLVELRNKFEDSGIENMSFKEYMQSFESEYKSVKSVEAQVMASGKLDIDYYNDVMSKLKFERNIDNLEHIKKVYDEYNLQVEQGLIPSTKTFLEFSQIEILKLKRLEDSIEKYIASPGDNPAPNFEITAKLIQDCIASDQKKEYLNNILDEAKRVYKTRDNILVEGIVFVNDEVKLGHTDKPDIDLEPTKDPDGNLVPSGFKTTGLKDKDGNVFDIEATTDGTVMFSDKNTDAVDFINFVATNMNNLTNKVRLAIFLTLHKNDSLTEPQKYELLQRVYNGLAERAKGTDTTAYSIVKQLAVIDKALKLINKTFAGKSDEGGANPLDGKVILDMLKSRYNIDPESRTYILDRVDYISIFDIINGVAKFSNIISSRKIENLKNRIIIGDYTPKERILDDEISTLNPIRDKKIISERDIRKYLEPVVKDNPNFTKEQVNALVNVIKYYSYNLVRMGIIKNTADIFKSGILPEMKLWNVTRRFTLANIAKNPDILFQAIGEKGAKRVKEIYDKRLLAEKLKQKGYTELGIKQLTGWEYDAFLGEWIFETNDSDIKLNFPENKVNVLDSGDGFTIKMGDLLGIDYEIFKYYPKLRDLNVTFTTKLPENTRGTYTTTLSGKSLGIALRIGNIGADVKLDKNTIEDIVLKNTSTDSDSHAQWKSTLLHEIQHFIQTEEAFPNGTSVEAIKPLVEEYLNKKDGISIDDIESGMYDTEIESIAYNLYLRTFGEIQARSSAERLQMTPEERAISLFTQHTGIPDSEKIKIINTAIVKNLANQETYKLEKEKLFQIENLKHGSPYDFDKFSTDKIGTGEGAQAFGWGLYFTTLDDIAEHYAKVLSNNKKGSVYLFDGIKPNKEIQTIITYSERMGIDISKDSILQVLNDTLKDYEVELKNTENKALVKRYETYITQTKKNIDFINNTQSIATEKNRNLYKVTLHKGKTPEEYEYLEWYKPMEDDAINKIKTQAKKEGVDISNVDFGGDVKHIYTELGQHWYFNGVNNYSKEVSLFLLRAGIDGIKYPAESISRGATSDNTRGFNYVVFDDKAISIESKKMFQVEDDYIRGMYDHANNVITILKNGKIDTLMHELGHSFRFTLKEYAEKGNAKAKEYMDAFDDFAMSEEGKKFFDSQEFKGEHNLDNFQFINEFFARSFESYLHDGGKGGDGLKITDMNVRRLLSHFKEWMKEIYGAVKSGAIKIKLTKEVRDVFESLIGNKNKLFDLETYIETAYGRLSIRENIDKKVVVDIIEQMKNNILDPDTRKASLDYLHKIFEAYKKQYIGQRYKGNSRLINPDLMKLIKTPKFSTPEGYEKHMKLFEAIISNSRFKFAWQQMNRFRESAVKNVYAKRRTNVEFYNLLMRLARVNPEFIGISEDGVRTKIGELESYNRLLQTTPSDMGILDFTKRVEYYEEKSKQYEAEVAQERLNNSAEAELNGIDINDTYEPYTPSDYEVMQLRKGREEVTSKARDYAIQQGKVDITKPTESEFFSLDISDMTDAELKRYGEILSTISRSPEGYTVGPEVVNLIVDVNSRKAEELIQQDISDFWRKKLREINNSWQRSHGTALRSLSNRFLNPYGFGALSNYNLKDALNFLDGIREDYGGVMVQTIFAPLEANSDRMRTTLNNVFTNINQFKGNKDSNMNLTLGQFNKIGVYWLLSQKPDIKISKDDFEYFRDEIENINTNVFEDAGIDIVDAKKLLMPGDVLSADMFYVKDKNGVYEQRTDMKESDAKLFEIYTKLLDLRLKHIKDSIIISHGERPEGMSDVDYNRHIKIMTNSTDIMMSVSGHQVEKLGTDGWADVVRSHVRDKRLQLLSATGHNSVAELVESKIELNDREKEFYGIGVSLFDRLQSGEFTDGRTMKETSDAYTNNQDSPYESVRNYAPMLRFNESKIEGSEAFEDEAGKVRPDYQFRTRNNLSTSTQFLKSRKRSITSLNTNAFEMIEKRFDQELFYMLNEPHRVFLNGLFKKEIFNKTDYDKKVDDGTIDNISLDYIKNNISVYYRRGITAGKMAIKDDKLLSKMMNMIDDFKIVALSPIRQSFGQVTSGFISQANLYGDPLRRFTDLSNGYADVFNPLSGQKVSDMIQNYAPEVAFRGLSDYDLGTQRVSPKMKDLYKRYWNGEFKHEKGYFGELINSFKDRRGANQRALLPMIYFDRLAARATFMGAYRNYCFHNGLELNFDLPDADAIKFAINVVRKSQSTDNELFKPGVLNGIRAQENYNPYDTSFTENSAYAELFRKGYWNFKSFSLAEKNNIAIKMIKAFRGEGSTLAEKSDAIASLAYSFTGSMLYDMSKSFFKAAFSSVGLYIGYMVGLNGKGPSSRDDDKNFIIDLIKGEFGDINVKDKDASDAATGAYRSSIQNNLTWNKEEGNLTDAEGTKEALVYGLVKNAVQQFGINEVGQAALSMALLGLQRARMKPNELPGRMDKMLTQSEELNLLGMMTDVFNPQILTGEKINSKSYVNDLYEFGRAIVSDEYNVTPDMWTTATQFGASAAGMGTFSRLPMSYPSIHQWIKDNNSYRKMIQKDYENTGVNPTPTETGIINEQNSKQQDDNTSDE